MPAWVPAGAHVTSVGYAPPAGSFPVRSRMLRPGCSSRIRVPSSLRPSAAPSSPASTRPAATTLGEVIVGSAPGRGSRDEITVYKAMGVAIEDLVAAELAYRTALSRGLGHTVVL